MDDNSGYAHADGFLPIQGPADSPLHSQREDKDFFQCQSSEVRLIFADVHKIHGA